MGIIFLALISIHHLGGIVLKYAIPSAKFGGDYIGKVKV